MTSNQTALEDRQAPLWPVRHWWRRIGQATEWREHPRLALGAVFVLVWAAAAMLFYYRFPNNFQHPNFYAEDGYVFGHNVLAHGFWKALMTTFDGYFIWGVYLVEGAGFGLARLLFGGQLVDVPKSLALASYGFLGLVAALPVVLLKPYLNLAWRLVAALAIGLVPLLGFDYAVIGTTGNLKFAFVPVAFMLLLYRMSLPRRSRQILLVDLGLLLCAYTDATVYLMLPALLACDGLRPRQLWQWRTVLRRDNLALWSALALGVALVYQLWVVATNGIPAIPGYLDGPLEKRQLPEIVIGRSFLFTLTYWWYRHLRNAVAAVLLVLVLWLMWRYGRREHRPAYALAVWTVFVSTMLFVVARPGVTGLFHHYGDSGPDQFFYGQNLVFALALVLLAADWSRRLAVRWRPLVPLLAATALILPAGQAGSWGAHDFMQRNVGTVAANAQAACRRPGNTVTIPIYPTTDLHFSASRKQLCTADVRAYKPDEVSLGLEPAGNHYVALNSSAWFRQTFRSQYAGLSGLSVYFSTFGNTQPGPYQLVLYDARCQQTLRTVALPSTISDNTTVDLRFAVVPQSAGRQYCFTVRPTRVPAKPLAVQLTVPGAYPDGRLSLSGRYDPRAVVFGLAYPNHN